jgi:hypothetical protein
VAGGTQVAPAFELVNQIIETEQLDKNYNIYVFYGTDGDDWDNEGEKMIPALKKMLSYANRIGITIARNNWRIMFPNKPGDFRVGDALTHDFRRYGDKLIVYMFNPFSTMVLLQFLRNLKGWPTVLIYNVPAADTIVRASGFTILDERSGQNQNQTTYIYKNF